MHNKVSNTFTIESMNKKKILLIILILCSAIFFYVNNKLLSSVTVSQTESIVLNATTSIGKLPSVEKIQQPFSVLFFGDAMFDRWVRDYVATLEGKSIFEKVAPLIENADITVLNLEGPITASKSVASYNNLSFTFPTSTALLLARNGIDVVGLANNHTHNFGRAGLASTRSFLNLANVEYFGDPYNSTSTLSHVITKNGIEIAFVGYHAFTNPDLKPIIAEIKMHKALGRLVIFSPHWGNEYQKKASRTQIDVATQAVAAGADLVVGAHPHVVQNIETIKNTPVVYSLGNFIFDQWFSKDVQEELALKIWIDPSTRMITSFELIPMVRTRYVPEPIKAASEWCASYTASSSIFTRFFKDAQTPCILERSYE